MEAQGHILIRRKAKNGIDGTNGNRGKTGCKAVFSGNPNGLKA